MIELNCSYEESKKILELGYDFSKVCWKSQYWYNSDGIAEHIHGTGLLLSTIEYRIKSNGCKDAVITGVIPIIPKAALEACLPELSGSIWLKNLRTNWMILDLDPHIIKLESIFKAFLWCHENYPEELKRKFKEVMK